ncbi:hypothetical protein LTR09_001832 [Extremus antarcticus]|uniref:Anaphase-promoting complex subunit 4 n=1 Tax=Extremus antarcticus TaxID=702011 RepID=A0AAJ0LWD5_9PEZI|nr:hypothetical protein LTR09_001832 [Extremus antarcticus]
MVPTTDSLGHTLPLLFEKHLGHPIDPSTAAYCDLYDLIAVINPASDDVTVYRAINGQIAFTAKYPDQYEESKPRLVSWKPDGSLLGVAWEDGTCCLYSCENGKLVSRLSSDAEGTGADWKLDLNPSTGPTEDDIEAEKQEPSCLAWTYHLRPTAASQRPTKRDQQLNGKFSTEDWFDMASAKADATHSSSASVIKHGVQDLVDSITTLDVTTVLPGLSALPTHGLRGGSDAAKFTNQPGVDNAFTTTASGSDIIDVLLVCGSSQSTEIYLDDTVKIGNLTLDTPNAFHASHPQCAAHAILVRPQDADESRLHFVDLPLDTLGGSLLHVIAANTKRLQDLMVYVTHTVRCIQHDFITGQQLPTRLVSGFTEELREKDEGDPVTALYELLMTARFTPTVTEWLTDVVKDTPRKRWEESVTNLYDHIQNHIFMHLLPALNRLSIVASSLRGQAELHEGTSTFDVPAALLAELEDDTDALRLAAERAQLIVIAEQRQFRAFIKWLRVMIDVASAGPGSKSAIETEQRETPNVDYNLTGAYIKHTMGKSRLAPYLEQPDMGGSIDKDGFFEHPIIKTLKRSNTVALLRKMNSTNTGDTSLTQEGSSETQLSLNLPALTTRLAAQGRVSLEKITAWQQRMLARHTASNLSGTRIRVDSYATLFDVKMFPTSKQGGGSMTQILLLPAPDDESCRMEVISVTRTRNIVEDKTTELLFDYATVLYAQIVDSQTCFVLVLQDVEKSGHDTCKLVSYRLEEDRTAWSKRVMHEFSASAQAMFAPKHFTVGGRPGKKVIVVFGDDDRSWQVLDLDEMEIRDGKLAEYTSNDEMQF